MLIDLSEVEVFKSDQLDLDRKITFIFGKNGTGKTTLTERLKRMSDDYEVSVFKGFSDIIDENNRLNAVVLGEENTELNRRIDTIKAEIESKNSDIEAIMTNLTKPDDDSISNFWTKREDAKKDFLASQKKVNSIYSKVAARIKNMDSPRVAPTSYNKNNIQEDMHDAATLPENVVNQYVNTIKSEVKSAPILTFPKIDFENLKAEVNDILEKTVTERVKISRLENNAQKREFVEMGYKIHKKGEYCAFCGNKIDDNVWSELESYFSADEVKVFQDEIQRKISEIKELIEQIDSIEIESSNFYPEYITKAKEIEQQFSKMRVEIHAFLKVLVDELDEKQKYLFEIRGKIKEGYTSNLADIENEYAALQKKNNENDLAVKQQEAISKLRKHYAKKYLDEFEYDSALMEMKILEKQYKTYADEYDTEQKKISGIGGLEDVIKALEKDISILQSSTKNEIILAKNINAKLKHMVSFELVHVEDEGSKGFYRIKNSITGLQRDVTELSTGEKNIIAFLYFIEKLDEVKETHTDKERIIVFDDPMSSNDDGMQYLIIEELQNLMKRLSRTDHFVLLTHNKHFYLNVKYGHKYDTDRFIRFQSDGNKTLFITFNKEKDDYKTSYELLWSELKLLYEIDTVSADLLLNPIRRIIETYTKFNAINKGRFCASVDGAMKLFNVNSHSIDDAEAELNGKTKNEIIQMFYDCFAENNMSNHFKSLWGELEINEDGRICFPN